MASILCIDDDPLILEFQRKLLTVMKHSVLTASDGLQGVTLARNNAIDVVVLDFQMPGLNGSLVAEMIAVEHPRLPIIIRTGYTDGVPESTKYLAEACLQKGNGPQDLLAVLEQILSGKRQSRKAFDSARADPQSVATI